MSYYTIHPQPGYSSEVAELVSMLEHARAVTLEEVAHISQAELDQQTISGNTIGALLFHIAAVEKVHQLITFEGRDFNAEEYEKWGAGIDLGEKSQGISGYPISFYIQQLEEVRKDSLRLLKSVDQDWLFGEKKWPNGVLHNNYYLWYHVMEDEIRHRGQIRIFRKY